MPPKPPKLKRAFSGLALTTNDVRTIAFHAERAGTLEVRANGSRLMDVGQVDQVIAEDVVLERLVVTATVPEGTLEFSYQQSWVQVRADEDAPELREPFAAIVALLESKPRTGFERCSMDVSPPGSWTAPSSVAAAPTPAAPPAQPSSRMPSATPARGGMLARWFNALPFRRSRSGRR
jgi:hypothetical protein